MPVSLLMGQILALCGIALGGLLIHRLTRLDVTLASLVSGVIASVVIVTFELDTGLRANLIQDLVFYVILPLLIYEAAWGIDLRILRKWILNSFVLATAGVLISAGIVAVIVYYSVGHPSGFPWVAALLTGVILSATDPVAVTAQLSALKAPKDLATLFEGESLFNDATAVVLFGVVLAVAQQDSHATDGIFVHFLWVFFGGSLVGAGIGLLSGLFVLLLAHKSSSIVVLVFSAFLSFYVAEHFFHVSGIMSVMLSAIIAKVVLHDKAHTFLSGVPITWSWLGLFFNILIFALMGLLITPQMFTDQWLAILIAIAAVTVARFVAVFFCNEVMGVVGKPVPRAWSMMLSWGGLRGAIAIALVLSLPTELSYWWTIQSMVFGVVLFTLLVQGTTTAMLMRKLKIVS